MGSQQTGGADNEEEEQEDSDMETDYEEDDEPTESDEETIKSSKGTKTKSSIRQMKLSDSSTDYEGYKPNKKPIPAHDFYPATYVSVTGKSSEESAEILPEEKRKVLDDVYNSLENKEGKYIKFVLGSKVMNEGISLRHVAEVHVLDVYFNLGKVDQVVGRAIRQCSHYKQMNEENKFPFVNVYRYVVTLGNKLSTEEELYRKAEQKYMLIKKVERAIKTIAIDCPLNVYGNMFKEEVDKYADCIENGKAEEKNACPVECDYQKCSYKCDDFKLNADYYDPTRQIYKKIPKANLDYSTFTQGLARDEIEYAKKKIKELYLIKYEYNLEQILDYVKSSYDEDKRDLFDDFFVFKALDELLPVTENDFISFSDAVIDKYNRQGYLIYVGTYYIFQPLDQNEDVPMHYRTTFDKTISNRLSLMNYLKNIPDFKAKGFGDLSETETSEETAITGYNFDKTMDYYDNRDEFKYVGIIDKETERRQTQEENVPDIFKIREKRSKILDKKRGTGIPSLKGAVCSTSKNKEYLEKIAKELKIDTSKDETRINICDKIKERMLFLEKYDKTDTTYIMVPFNHPVYPFPYNLKSRIDYIKSTIKDNIKFKLDINVKETKKTSGLEKGYPSYQITISDTPDLKPHTELLQSLGAKKEKNTWMISIE